MKIYDCYTFYNEFDLLELRLQESYDHVDHIVIVEGCTTFTDIPKPYYFEENKERYAKWLDKIIHVKVDDMPHSPDAWVNDIHQRNSINRGIVDADDNDIIIVSDLDEIIRPSTYQTLREDTAGQIWGLRMPLFNFTFNHMMITSDFYTVWGMACRKHAMIPADEFRRLKFQIAHFPYGYNEEGIRIIEHAGWQFTYLGDVEFARNKIRSFAHQETNTPEILNSIDIESSLANGNGLMYHPDYRFINVQMDDYMPQSILNNLDKYTKYIGPIGDKSALDYLPQS